MPCKKNEQGIESMDEVLKAHLQQDLKDVISWIGHGKKMRQVMLMV